MICKKIVCMSTEIADWFFNNSGLNMLLDIERLMLLNDWHYIAFKSM